MLAVFAAVQAAAPADLAASASTQALIAACFLIGALCGVRRLAASIGGGLASSARDSVVVTELSGAGAQSLFERG